MPKFKEKDRQKIANDIAAFLKKGGEIELIADKFKPKFSSDEIKKTEYKHDLIDAKEAALLIGCATNHVCYLYNKGFLTTREKISGYGRKYFYCRKEVRKLVKERRMESEKTI